MHKFCPNCGKKNDGWSFCPDCGASLEEKESGHPMLESDKINMGDIAERARAEAAFLQKAEVSNGVLIKYIGEDENLIIPEIITEIGVAAFEKNETLISVTLPKSLKTIKWKAFAWCKNLKKVNMSFGVEKIEHIAFSCCSSLEEIILPNSITVLEPSVFEECTSLKKAQLSRNLKKLEFQTFYHCNKLMTLFIPKNINRINAEVFRFTGLVDIFFESDCLPEFYVNNIPAEREDSYEKESLPDCYALYHFSAKEEYIHYLDYDSEGDKFGLNLNNYDHKEFKIEEQYNLDKHVLTKYYGEKSYVKIPFGVRSLEMEVVPDLYKQYIDGFQCNGKIESIVFPETVFKIASHIVGVLSGCYNLREVVLPKRLKEIPSWCFNGCKNLRQISIPDSVKMIGSSAFRYSGIESIKLPDEITEISDSLFANCGKLKKIDIPYGVKRIGEFAFCGCHALESIVIPEGVESLGRATFGECTALKTVVIPKSLIDLDTDSVMKSFRGCTALEYIYLPRGRKEVFKQAFPFDYEAPKIKFIEQ